jgi:hypothetical protein
MGTFTSCARSPSAAKAWARAQFVSVGFPRTTTERRRAPDLTRAPARFRPVRSRLRHLQLSSHEFSSRD